MAPDERSSSPNDTKISIAPAKLDEFTSKTNILKKFVEKVTGKSEL